MRDGLAAGVVAVEDDLAGKIAIGDHAEGVDGVFGIGLAERCLKLFRRPDVIGALLAF